VLHPEQPRRISRRVALQLGGAAGATAVAAPYLSHLRSERGIDVRGAQLALTRNPNWPAPGIVTRSQWGANERIRESGQIYDATVSKIVVHHTGTPNSVTDYAGLCRGIYQNEVAGEYIDMAYNWLIDPAGRIYEGRWAMDYPAGAVHTGERNGANVRGGHALNHNTQTIGIALMGTYDTLTPSVAMQNSLVSLLAWKCARWGLDPNGRSIYVAGNGAQENLFNICGHRDTGPTDCPGTITEGMLPSLRARVAARLTGGGYWIATSGGPVYSFGGVPNMASPRGAVAGIAGIPAGNGSWIVRPNGAVLSFGSAGYYGGMQGRRLSAPIIGIAPTASGRGYWLVGQDGGIFSFGDAKFFGSTGAMRLKAPVLGMVATSTGNGYWLYARDGGIFTFGDAKFMGSTGAMRLAKPVVSMAARPQGDGYWLVAADGGIFTFGRAQYRGSGASMRGAAPVVGMLPSTSGNGYVILRCDGTVQSYGDAPNMGDARGLVGFSAIGIAGKLKPL
jgi:hypothetical protein